MSLLDIFKKKKVEVQTTVNTDSQEELGGEVVIGAPPVDDEEDN